MNESPFDFATAILPWAAVVYKSPSLFRAPRDVGRQSLWLTLFFLSLSATALVPPIYVGLDHLLAYPNLARLLSNCLTLCACWSVLRFLAHLSGVDVDGHEVKWTALLLGSTLLVMTGLFLTAPVFPDALDYPERYAMVPRVLEYRLIYLLYVGVTVATLTRLCWRYARVASHASLHLGLLVVSGSGVAGLLYVADELSYQIARRLSIAYALADILTVQKVLVILTVGLAVTGATLPAWGPRVGVPRFYWWVWCRRALWRLYPLWLDLVRSSPEIALDQPRSRLADMFNFGDVDFRLHRRVVEIRDGILTLRPYVDPAVSDLAAQLSHGAGLDQSDVDASIEAASIVAGQWAKAKGRPIYERRRQPTTARGEALESEVAELERVAWFYAQSPVIREIKSRLAAGRFPDLTVYPIRGTDGTLRTHDHDDR